MDTPATFENEDTLWDEFPYDPYTPAGIVSTAHPGDRRIVGRTPTGDVVCVTDLPRHFCLDDEPGSLTHTMQFFTTPRTYLEWLTETCRRTRFTDRAPDDPQQRFTIALGATLAGLEWDLDGNILVEPPAPLPFGAPRRRDEFVIAPVDFTTWTLRHRDGSILTSEERGEILDRNLWDIAYDDGVISFITEIPTTG
ncbi:hypothetical protein GCM10011512_25170 [Tersicoccus solisilvae]|uniref:Uncharacterized protein n=1 Tax=Tersicoccus solisilvae TaxID=1882339 RepID=A0ABQ1PH27_9MICC|nr:hypothetical protein [Tersicoccus solisilvae]GGC97123.1 hypothetical protein GCM10011512_25170 [Tersicoccus solisilvae]